MNRIDTLIAKLCPHGVEFVDLGCCAAYSDTRIDARELSRTNFVGGYRPKLNPEFLYRILASDAFFAYSMQHAKGAKMPRGSKEVILKYRIPLPLSKSSKKS